jgi:hypothetical protein
MATRSVARVDMAILGVVRRVVEGQRGGRGRERGGGFGGGAGLEAAHGRERTGLLGPVPDGRLQGHLSGVRAIGTA